MKKTFTFLLISLAILFAGCGNNNIEDYSEVITLEIGRIDSNNESRTIDITYPIIGGLSQSESITMINNSIQNYVEMQQKEFENALDDASDQETPINQEMIEQGAENTDREDDDTSINDESESDPQSQENEEDADENPTEDSEVPSEDEVVPDENQTTDDQDATATKNEKPIALTMGFEITYNKNNIINIVENFEKSLGKGKDYIVGQHSFIFDLNRGVPLTLGELFDFDGEFPNVINSGIESQIKSDSSLITFEDQKGFSGISKDANFYIDEENLYIFYNALEIGPEKNLIPTFTFSLKDLEPYLLDEYTDSFK
ncbi:MAG: hypothetical protein U0M15_10035 [Bacillota bacterium]|nr:hypothetical protein [Bacillota bacterium]